MQKIFIAFSLFIPFMAASQTDTASGEGKPHIQASADVYYRYNTNAPGGSFNNFTKFTNTQNTFALGMISVKGVDSFGKVSGVANIGFGPRVNEYNYAEAGNSVMAAIKELYISYAATPALQITAGKWYKHLGYETPDAAANPNYSASYAFSFGPMSYTGIKARVILGKKVGIMAGIANPADITGVKYSPTKTAIAGIDFTALDNRLKVKLNFQGYGGVSNPYLLTSGYYLYRWLYQYDAVVELALSHKLDIVYNGTYQYINDGNNRKWNSNLVYLIYKWTPGFSTAVRGEYFDDRDAVKLGADVFAVTASANFTVNSRLRFTPEIRLDNSSDNIFQKGSTGGASKTVTGLLAVIYAIGK